MWYQRYFITGLFIMVALVLFCQDNLPAGAQDMIHHDRLQNVNYQKGDLGSARVLKAEPEWTLELKTLTQPSFIYNLSLAIPLKKQPLPKGQVLLLSFEAKTTASSLETGEAKGLWLLRQSDSYKENIENAVSFSSEWKTYYFPLETTQTVSKKALALVIQFGYPPQGVQIRKLKLLAFPKGTLLEALPKTKISYAGQEADATWRTLAEARIKTYRQGQCAIQLADKKDRPLKNTTVQIALKRHHFLWGAAVNAKRIIESPDHVEHLSQAFNLVVFENDLKMKPWAKHPDQTDRVRQALEILREKKLDIKGHVLIWPGYKYLPASFRKARENPEKIEKMLARSIKERLQVTEGRLSHWDVVNEAYTNKDLQAITGSEEILYDGFRVLQKKEPGVLRFTNEYGIISKGGHDIKKQEWYYEFIKRIDKNTGGAVDGIGIQCHIGTDLTSPERVLEILDYYSRLNKKISISEFTMEIKSPDIRKQYTQDFILAAFSHPAVHEFLFWGYYRPDHEKAALFNEDWTLAPMGEVFYELVHNRWNTVITAATNAEGEIVFDGFYGAYEYTFVDGNQLVKGTFEHLPNHTDKINIKYP